jgi:DNA polymerase-3 subunit epsilon
MNYIAIDFETANEKRNSPCSIGIVVVRNGHVVEKIHHLIRPKEMRFMPINIGIHGIRPAMVENEPEFDKVWEKIKNHFNENLVLAHNASFDISVLRKSAELYNIELPSFQYICTMKLSRNFYKGIENAKLNTVNDFLGYEFKHHDALYDALACSNILLNICEELKSTDINEISKLIGVTIGTVDSNGYKPSRAAGKILKTSNRINNPKKENKFERLEEDAFKIAHAYGYSTGNAGGYHVASALQTPLLVPVFPRPITSSDGVEYYTHDLDRSTMLIQSGDLKRIVPATAQR